MGDATLKKWKNCVDSTPALIKSNKNLDHITWFSKFFESDGNIKEVECYLKATQKKYKIFRYRTKADPNLEYYHKRWYPEWNDFKKVIPDDVIIDQMFMLQWFMDDGFSSYRSRKDKLESAYVEFCCECFEKDQIEQLRDKINEKYDLNMVLRKRKWKNSKEFKEGYRLRIPQSKTNKFFEIIGECPVESLKYKWKII